jgi:short-subunit dehydrogenase
VTTRIGAEMDLDRYGPWALVIGGSDGVGASFARKLAAQGFKLVIVARRPGPLNELAEELRAKGAEVRVLSADLTREDALERTRAVTDDIEVGLLIYNAGVVGPPDDFINQKSEQYRGYITLNVINQAEFAHHYGGLMGVRGRGGIMLVGSSGSFMGAPKLAIYTGVKAFSRVFTEGLWVELEPRGVDVLHYALGFTDTPTIRALGIDTREAEPPDVAAQNGLDNIANGPLLIGGGQAGLQMAISRSGLTNRAADVRSMLLRLPPD